MNNNSDKTEEFVNYFEAIFRRHSPMDKNHEKFINAINKQVHTEFKGTIHIEETMTEELQNVIETLRNRKAPVRDRITNTAIKHLTEAIDTL
ncbi:hypothetical protein Trydic_g12899 [Trypoxylus dichotomus]